MSISALAKINIYFHNEKKDQLIRRIQKLACLHVVDFKDAAEALGHDDLIPENEISDLELERKISDLNFVIKCLSPFEKRTGIANMLAGKKIILSGSEYEGVIETFDESDTVKSVKELEKEEQFLLTEITNNENVMRELGPWAKLDINLEDIKDTQTACLRLGKIPASKLGSLKRTLDGITNLYELYEVNQVAESAHILVAFSKDFEDAIEDALTIENFERKDFHGYTGKITRIIADFTAKDEKDDERLDQIRLELVGYAKNLARLKVKYDHLYNAYKRTMIQRSFGSTDNVGIFEGFVDEKDLPRLKEVVEGEFKYAQVERVEIGKGDKVPTKLSNEGIVRSFELVTDLYGMPSVKSFDATAYLMPFFAVFFGLCLTDGGYGILLALISLVFIKKFKPLFKDSKLMRMLLICGLATVVAGAITGGWFGDIIEYLPESMSGIKKFKDSLILFDPMKDLMVFFALSVALGYIHLLFGLTLSFVNYVRNGELKEGLCTKMTWIAFLLTLFVWVMSMQGIFPKALEVPGKFAFIASCVAIVLFSETGASSFAIRIVSGLYNLYGATAYVGDTLSYLRLLALGLASGMIAVVVNTLCKLSLGIPYVGIIVAVLLFIGGHIFNLLMSALGAFVHTLRLNYAEFFPKFFEGGGKKFVPFKVESSYLVLSDENKN